MGMAGNILILFINTPYNQSFQFLIIALLIIYIGYLHFLLIRKTTRLREFDRYMEKIKNKYGEERVKNIYDTSATAEEKVADKREMILKEHILDFMFENEKARKIFIHYTKEEDDAKKILKEGFKFVDSFYKTAEEVRNDETDLIYKHNRHKSYGNNIIVISIDKDIYNYYLKETDKVPSYEIVVEQLLTEKPPYLNDDSEMIYTLHHNFVKGYINYVTGKVVENPDFNPTYNTNQFYENLKKLTFGD